MALTCPSVADCIFAFSPASPPAGPTVWQWVTAFINLLRILLLACKQFILFVQIDGINLPSATDFFSFPFSLFWLPCSSHYWQWLTGFVSALQIQFLVCEYLIWLVQIDPNDVYYRCRFHFRFFTYHPLQVQLFDHGWGNSLMSFGIHHWYISGLFYLFKFMALTYPSVADSIFSISPFWAPAAPNTQQRLMVFISALYTSFLVCKHLFMSILIATNDRYYCCIFYFRFFSLSDSLELPIINNKW